MNTTTKSTLGEIPKGEHDDSWHELQCPVCKHRHLMGDRIKKKDADGFIAYFCPKCGEESYCDMTIHGQPI